MLLLLLLRVAVVSVAVLFLLLLLLLLVACFELFASSCLFRVACFALLLLLLLSVSVAVTVAPERFLDFGIETPARSPLTIRGENLVCS